MRDDSPERRARLAARQMARAIEQRDHAMCEMWRAGASFRQIAAAVGMTHTGVRHILRKHLKEFRAEQASG